LPAAPSRAELAAYAGKLAIAIIRPV